MLLVILLKFKHCFMDNLSLFVPGSGAGCQPRHHDSQDRGKGPLHSR